MAITKDNVLELLKDGRLKSIRFSVGQINVNPGEYDRVRDLVELEAIHIGKTSGKVALYYPQKNTLALPNKDFSQIPVRCNVLHECTHIISDYNQVSMRRLEDEVAAYLAQITYQRMLAPNWEVDGLREPTNNMMRYAFELIDNYSLGKPKGNGASISTNDIRSMANLIHAMPDYAEYGNDEMLAADGVDVDDEHIEAFFAREATRSAESSMSRDMREDAERQMIAGMKYSNTAKESYPLIDSDMITFSNRFARGDVKERTAVFRRVFEIFLSADQRVVTNYYPRLSTLNQKDLVSVRFFAVFNTDQRALLLRAMKER